MIEKDLEEFGRSMGIENLSFNESNCIKLAIENSGDVYIQKVNQHFLFYILKRFEVGFPDLYWEALKMGYPQETYAFLTHAVAFLDDQIGFAVRLREESCDLPTLNRVFRYLRDTMKKLESNLQSAK